MGVFRKQLLYLTNDQLTAFQWQNGSLSIGHIFSNDEIGWEDFSDYLDGSSNTLTYLLADLIEEDFQRDTLPHVLGRSRQKLVQRRVSQIYRDTPYRCATQQGREEAGRRDDRMLFSALTNMELLKPWLDKILTQKIPLTGIYSPALLSTTLLKKLGLTPDNMLLVTHHSCGLRQSFFQDSALKFSRLTPLAKHHPDTVAETVAHETANLQQFLASTRLLSRSETLNVVIVTQKEVLSKLQFACHDTATLAYRFFDLADAASLIGIPKPDSVMLCDSLFLSMLGHSLPANQYAQQEQTRYYLLQQARIFFYIFSVGIFAGGLLWTALNCMDAMGSFMQNRQMEKETQLNLTRYQDIMRDLPHTVASPQSMKVVVNIEQTLASNAPTPGQLLGMVSHTLDTLPQIRLNQLHWQVSSDTEDPSLQPEPAPTAQPGEEGNEPAPTSAMIGLSGKPVQTLLIEGEVTPFENDYRTAMENVRLFAAELAKYKQLKVEVTQMPLDFRPAHILRGSTGNGHENTKAEFTLKLTLRPEN